MAKLQLYRGLPEFDWREGMVDALAHGAFAATGTGLTQVVLQSGANVLTISGTGIDVGGARTITAGTITSAKLTIDGVDVALFDSFITPLSAASVQAILTSPPADVWDGLEAVIADEPLNAIGSVDEDWILGGAGNDTVAGGDERDLVFTRGGDDTIYAADTIRFWGDYIQPGLGTNTIIAPDIVANPDGYVDGHDLSFSDLMIAVTANLGTGVASGTGMLTTFQNVHWLIGGAGNDALTGGYAPATQEGFSGMIGDDTINGQGGRDVVDYSEEVNVGSTNLSGVWTLGSKGVKVDLAAGTATDSFGGHDTLIKIEVARGTKFKDQILGSSKGNELVGYEGADKLDGRGGNDTLDGGLGKDTLTGGDGRDLFVFNTKPASNNVDKIVGFKSGSDSIELDDSIFKGIGGKLDSGEFLARSSGHAASDNSDRIIYDQSNGSLWYDRDGAKTKYDAVQIAILDSHPTLKFGDFDMIN